MFPIYNPSNNQRFVGIADRNVSISCDPPNKVLGKLQPLQTIWNARSKSEYLKMIGAGSCGVGVIMAARDFLERGPSCINSFAWRYSDMDLHRKNLMLQILDWAHM